MAKKVEKIIKLQIRGGQATPAPPIGPALGQAGVNIMEFCKQFNAATQDRMGVVLPVVITVYSDKSFTFVVKSPPAAELLKKSGRYRERRQRSAAPEGGESDVGGLPGNRQAEDGRPERLRSGEGGVDDRRDGTFDGDRGGRKARASLSNFLRESALRRRLNRLTVTSHAQETRKTLSPGA